MSGRLHIEFAPFTEDSQPSSSLRLCREFEKKIPDIRGCQLELMKSLCSELARESESYLIEGCVDAWRRTIIYVEHSDIFSAERCNRWAANFDGNARDIQFMKLVRELVVSKDARTRIEIRSNILPGEAYMERLLKLESQSFWTRVHNMMMGSAWSFRKRGFFPKSILDSPACLTENKSLLEVVNTWREQDGGRCCLARHLEDTRNTKGGHEIRKELTVREIPRNEVQFVRGLDFDERDRSRIDKVLWNNRMYARKSFDDYNEYQRESNRIAFDLEHSVALKLRHPHLATAFGCSSRAYVDFGAAGVSENAPFLLMELMTYTLSDLVRCWWDNPYLSRAESIDVLLQIGLALDHMHTNNVVHGDLRPQNILVSPFEVSGNERYLLVKVTNFVQAHFKNPGPDQDLLEVNGFFGTTQYSAPEVLSLQPRLDEKTVYKISEKLDVYSFGAVAYEILTGHEVRDYYNSVFDDYKSVGKRWGSDYLSQKIEENIIKGDLRLKDSEEWRKLIVQNSYPLKLTELVEKCLELDPKRRPTFSEICKNLKKCKPTGQLVLEPLLKTVGYFVFGLSFQRFRMITGLIFNGVRILTGLLFQWVRILTGLLFQWVRILTGLLFQLVRILTSDQQVSSRYKRRVKSQEITLRSFLGQGCSGFLYEITWSRSQENTGRLARKLFPDVKGDVFEREVVRLIKLTDHPNIVKIFCWTVDRRSCSLIMEFVSDNLSNIVRKKTEARRKEAVSKQIVIGTTRSGPFQFPEAIQIVVQIAKGIRHLHGQNIYHGDLKPNNVLIDGEIGPMSVKLADFGLVKTKRRTTLVSQRTLCSHMIAWSAPEIVEDYICSMSDDLDYLGVELNMDASSVSHDKDRTEISMEKADTYSFALLCAYVFGGKVWDANLSSNELRKQISSSGLRPKLPSDCPEALASLISSCWDADPERRPSFSSICDELDEIVKDHQREKKGKYPLEQPEETVRQRARPVGGKFDA
ncbi:hypothetical protein KC19_11G066300 [Ceratodon purpureus]|uniref:Protein kinase domain-containing protein n=1 Tax=Ceratodon purpureus TaxID=3225 RepID=A0A8T0GHG0_CERPU|nr:hypothetical protein KC19_11G066300 [Ceratodon purpureus]